ncbi:MAG: hypothetical protein U1E83_02005 [Methylotetracoccus sp.]
MKTKAVLSSLAALVAVAAISEAQAHEGRLIGGGRYQFFVGSWNEPAYAGFENGIDLFPIYCSGPGGCADENNPASAIDTSLGDTLSFTTYDVLYWPTDDAANTPANALYTSPMAAAPRLTFASSGTKSTQYKNYYFPTMVGAYGFHLAGTVQKKGKVAKNFDEYFICGKGTQSATSAFGCYAQIQRFPTAPATNSSPSK